MKGEILFEKMTNIADEYVAEAAMGEAYGNPRRPRETGPVLRFLGSGWGAAVICALISITVAVALIRWGQAGTPVGPVGPAGPAGHPSDTSEADTPATDPFARFAFTYEFLDEEGHPQSTATLLQGESFTVNATVKNQGLPFVYVGSSGGFCPDVRFVHYGEEKTTIIHGGIFLSTDVGTHLVEAGKVGYGCYFGQIPADAPAGDYDLILSYKNDEQVFTGVLTVETVYVPPNTPVILPDLDPVQREQLCTAYAAAHPPLAPADVSIRHFYGQYPSGALVAMINDGSDVTDALWEEQVGPATIRYNNGNRILVYGNGHFYTLPEAYEDGLLSDSDLADIENIQRRYYESLYADPE